VREKGDFRGSAHVRPDYESQGPTMPAVESSRVFRYIILYDRYRVCTPEERADCAQEAQVGQIQAPWEGLSRPVLYRRLPL